MTLRRGTSLDAIWSRMRKMTRLQTPTVLWLGGGTISPNYSMCIGLRMLGRQEIHTAEPLVPEPRAFEIEWAIGKLKSHKSPGIDEIPAELIKPGGGTICGEIHKLITSVWKKEKLPEEWKESIIVPIHKKGDKRDCNNYRGISLLPTTYKILSNILLSRLTPYAKEIIGEHQCGFRRNRSTIDHIFCIRQILE